MVRTRNPTVRSVPVNMRAKRCPGPVESAARMRHAAREMKRRQRWRGSLRWREGPSYGRTWTRCVTVSRLPRATSYGDTVHGLDQLPSDVLNSFVCKEVLYSGCCLLYRKGRDHHCLTGSYKPEYGSPPMYYCTWDRIKCLLGSQSLHTPRMPCVYATH
jgi:hypothetical protein